MNLNPDQFAFLNRQLAALIADGVPLEGALRETARDLSGPLQSELRALESDLSQGIPLDQAIQKRRLPELYIRLVRAGAAGGDLGSALNTAADHFEETARLRRRTRSALTYPAIVLVVGIGLSFITHHINAAGIVANETLFGVATPDSATGLPWLLGAATYIPSILGILLTLTLLLFIVPVTRRWLFWKLPGFRDAHLSQVAASLGLLTSRDCPLPEAVRIVRQLEAKSPAGAELTLWESRLSSGSQRLSDITRSDSSRFPPLFHWLILSAGEKLPDGFARAARHYRERARYRFDLLIHGLLPISILVLGLFFVVNFLPVFVSMSIMLDTMGME